MMDVAHEAHAMAAKSPRTTNRPPTLGEEKRGGYSLRLFQWGTGGKKLSMFAILCSGIFMPCRQLGLRNF